MKQFVVFIGIVIWGCIAFAQSGSYDPNTGDSSLDSMLINVNNEAQSDSVTFIAEMSVEFNVPETTISQLYVDESIQPADIYVLLLIAHEQKKSLDSLLPLYKKNRGKGWKVVLKAMNAHKPAMVKLLKSNAGKKQKALQERRKMKEKIKMKTDKKNPKSK